MSEWHGRHGLEKLAPPRPSLEEILRLADRPQEVEHRLGLLKKQRDYFQKLLRGLTGVAASTLDPAECCIGGSFGRDTALNYHFDADVVILVEGFAPCYAGQIQDILLEALEDHFRRGVEFRDRTPYTLKLGVGKSASGDFATVDLITTGEPPDYHMDSDEKRYYSGADSSRVDNQIMNFAVKNPEFRPLVLLVKHWRNLGRDRFPHIKPITSYHLELLCMKVIRESEFNGLRDLFREFLELVVYSNNRLLVKNPNRYHGALQINGKGMNVLADYANETLNVYQRHIRPGNTAACPCCKERRFLSATGAVAHLESGNCSNCRGQKKAEETIQNFVSQHKHMQKFQRLMITDGYGNPCGDGNPYQCTSCDRTFAKFSSLMAHRQDKHGQVLRALAF